MAAMTTAHRTKRPRFAIAPMAWPMGMLAVAATLGPLQSLALAPKSGDSQRITDETGHSPLLTANDTFTQARAMPTHLGQMPPADGKPMLWSDAPKHVNHQVTIVGTVLATGRAQAGYPQFLQFVDGPRSKQPFEIVLFAGSETGLPLGQDPAAFYLGKTIQITRTVTTYNGKPQIAVDSEDLIKVVDPADHPSLGIQPAPQGLSGQVPVITWDQAKDHVGKFVCVTGKIVATHRSEGDPNRDDDGAIFLNYDKDYRGKFHLILFPSNYGQFGQHPEKTLLNQTLAITGKVTEHRGTPQIQLTNAAQMQAIQTPLP